MRFILVVMVLTSVGYSQETDLFKLLFQKRKLPKQIQPQQQKNQPQNLASPQSEVSAALAFAQHVAQIDAKKASYLRFFSMYNIPAENQKEIYSVLTFWIHSLVSPGFNIISPPKKVPGNNHLYYVDFSEYGWLRQSWEELNDTEPYFKEPWIHFEDLNNLRLITGGNSIVRADWFIMHTSDTTRQFDLKDNDILYYILIYGKGKEPKNLKEFQKAWGVDLARARKDGVDSAAILKSYIVSRHNRQLLRVRTGTGYYWETYDVLNTNGARDYIENLFPDNTERDAAEAIVSNGVGLQVYHLEAFEKGVGKRVEFGDPTAVRSIRDSHGDVRVRTARSCVSCHASGIISFQHHLRDLLKKKEFKIELAAREKEIQLEIQRFYFGPIEQYVQDDQRLFDRVMQLVNNEAPVDNTVKYNSVMVQYDQPVDLKSAALECGLPAEVFKQRIAKSVSARLLGLINGGTIPRTVWENPIINAGTFGHAMLLTTAVQKKNLNLIKQINDGVFKGVVGHRQNGGESPVEHTSQRVKTPSAGRREYTSQGVVHKGGSGVTPGGSRGTSLVTLKANSYFYIRELVGKKEPWIKSNVGAWSKFSSFVDKPTKVELNTSYEDKDWAKVRLLDRPKGEWWLVHRNNLETVERNQKRAKSVLLKDVLVDPTSVIFPQNKDDVNWLLTKSYVKFTNSGTAYTITLQGHRSRAKMDKSFETVKNGEVYKRVRFTNSPDKRYREVWFLVRERDVR